jgi:hypothetical protein
VPQTGPRRCLAAGAAAPAPSCCLLSLVRQFSVLQETLPVCATAHGGLAPTLPRRQCPTPAWRRSPGT